MAEADKEVSGSGKAVAVQPRILPRIVAVGSSAGGLEALRALLHRLPRQGNFSYVIAQHLSPHHLSMLTALLSRETSLAVMQVDDGMEIESSTIYVTPPNADVTYRTGQFRLQAPSERGPKPSVDTLLYSLAESIPERTIAVILSGSGSDGSAGARQLKKAGGSLIVQEPRSAKYPSMPQAAIATGLADAILAPEDIGPHLEKLLSGQAVPKPAPRSQRQGEIDQVLDRIKGATNIDFHGYKANTIYRRILQRVAATKTGSMAAYLRLLEESNEELQTLAQNCLISVTSFFRDAAAFEDLAESLVKRFPQQAADPLRVWSVGCATGEEAYSLSILLASRFPQRRIQIFATDLDEQAIAFARKGVYPSSALKQLPADTLGRHFSESVQGYTVERSARERVVFARHDIVHDPLFLNIDLIACRNVLIYFKPGLQEDILQKFHHALRPGGLLFLGRSENISGNSFDVLDRRHRIFCNRPLTEQERHASPSREWPGFERVGETQLAAPAPRPSALRSALVDHFAPRAVLVDENYQILETNGEMNDLLSIPSGRVNFSLLNLLPKSLGVVLRTLLQRAGQVPGQPQTALRTHTLNGKKVRIELSATALEGNGPTRPLLVAFREVPGKVMDREEFAQQTTTSDLQIEDLERELRTTRECLQATVEELETSNEELQALNEEMQASNEELQASNEELHASNEELQSTNEELLTVNEEIEHKSIELAFLIEDLENIQNSLDGPLLVADARGYLRHVNEEARRLFGVSAEALGGPILLPNDPLLANQLAVRVQHVIEAGESSECRVQSHGRHYRVLVRPYVGRHKANRGAVVVFHEISQLVGTHQRLKRSEQRLRLSGARHAAAINLLPANLAVLDAKGKILEVNSAWKRFAVENGYVAKNFGVGENYLEVCARGSDEYSVAIAGALQTILAGQLTEFTCDYPCHSPTERRWFRCLLSAVDTPGARGAVVMHFNITEQKLRAERDAFRLQAFAAVSYPVFTADAQGRVDWYNAAFAAKFEVKGDSLHGQPAALLELPGNPLGFTQLFQQARGKEGNCQAELRLAAESGEPLVVLASVKSIPAYDGTEVGYVAACEDITEQRLSEARMIYSAEHDELTGLLNRKSIIQRLEAAIERQRRNSGQVALLFVDLDRFKDTNDTLGHLVGDQILIEAANRLRANVPNLSNLARFGGDEFLVFVENPGTADDLEILVERLLLSFSRPVLVDGRPLQASASIGVAHFPQDAASAEELLRMADLAMYRAKADGRRGYRRFDQGMQQEIHDRVTIERDLARALTLKDLWVAFQPQIDLRTQRIVGAEALLRWKHPRAEEIPISKIIAVAEESGLILPIGQWVIREAIQQLDRWRSIDPHLRLSVNLSAVQFNQQDVFAEIMEQLNHYAISPSKLKVEITETVLLSRSARVRETLHALHGAGIGLHLDDFGTGYSSLSYLQQFPIEAVKIDSSFLLGVGRESQDEAIVDGIVKLAQSLRIDAVAEGVENEVQLKFLRESGCQTAQGFHWAKPLSAEAFTDYLIGQPGLAPGAFIASA